MPNTTYPFPHSRLEVYRVALEMAAHAKTIADGIPRGHRNLADQIIRASTSTVLNIGEGANRFTSGAKRQRYSEARGECGEAAAAAELLGTLNLAPSIDCSNLITLAGRVAAMLTRLIQRLS